MYHREELLLSIPELKDFPAWYHGHMGVHFDPGPFRSSDSRKAGLLLYKWPQHPLRNSLTQKGAILTGPGTTCSLSMLGCRNVLHVMPRAQLTLWPPHCRGKEASELFWHFIELFYGAAKPGCTNNSYSNVNKTFVLLIDLQDKLWYTAEAFFYIIY